MSWQHLAGSGGNNIPAWHDGGDATLRPTQAGVPPILDQNGVRFTSVARYWQEVHLPRSWTPFAQASWTDPITLRPGGGARDRKSTRLNSSHKCAPRIPS